MANLNKVMLIGRLTRDPEIKTFVNGETGPKKADLVESSLKKGQQIYVEGHLVLEEWTGKEDGKKASKMVVYVDDFQFLEKREGGAAGGLARRARRPAHAAAGGDDSIE